MSQQDPIDDLPPDLRAMLDLVREPPPLPPEVSDRMLRALDVRVIAESAAPSPGAGAKPTPGRGPFFRAPWQTLVGFLLGLVLGAAALALLEVGKVQAPHLYVFHVSLFSKESHLQPQYRQHRRHQQQRSH